MDANLPQRSDFFRIVIKKIYLCIRKPDARLASGGRLCQINSKRRAKLKMKGLRKHAGAGFIGKWL